MPLFKSGARSYGSGTYVDPAPLPIPSDAQRILGLLAQARPGFIKTPSLLSSVVFSGRHDPIVPGPLKVGAIAAALHGMCGIVANEILDLRDLQSSPHQPLQERTVKIDTNHAAFWLGTVGMTEVNGHSVAELGKKGHLKQMFKKDLEGDTFATPMRLRTTAIYETNEPGKWFQLHGSLDADPVLAGLGLDGDFSHVTDPLVAYGEIAKKVSRCGREELETMFWQKGLCGTSCYSPEEFRATPMSKSLDKWPLINYEPLSNRQLTPALQFPLVTGDARPLAGIKVVELVRIIAGPVIGCTLASMGAQSLRLTLNAGVQTVDMDLTKADDIAELKTLIQDADVFIQGYRTGSLARKGFGIEDLLSIAEARRKGIIYVDENCYGPDGPMHERPGWQQIADSVSGCSYVTGRALGHEDGTCVLPALPVPDILTGLVGAIGTMMALRDRARNGGSYHVFASLLAAAALPLSPEVGLYPPEVVAKCHSEFQWERTGPEMFVLELLDVVLRRWKSALPEKFEEGSDWFAQLKGELGDFRVLKPVVQLGKMEESPGWTSAPFPNCYYESGEFKWT
ncbi:hypothetical protein M409DRAFT_62403 [Zasmidium cellare ATCC 36951]|uniref:CoA-transferase family III n=1 Tax=Zasmidium cellare ATCC 36951 TaxID=1080233 RepID=A0A6A6D3E6_ZASCE|nr:uncharacterized protein M409DRAFT_62403 [Zasmidium cellare ATCC 36951]KAF2172649.1 hypothetical protein M409DRAFT_62403 [Zasmidium cellare ATCC 36951]